MRGRDSGDQARLASGSRFELFEAIQLGSSGWSELRAHVGWGKMPDQPASVPEPPDLNVCFTTLASTRKITSSAMFVAWSAKPLDMPREENDVDPRLDQGMVLSCILTTITVRDLAVERIHDAIGRNDVRCERQDRRG